MTPGDGYQVSFLFQNDTWYPSPGVISAHFHIEFFPFIGYYILVRADARHK